MKKERTVDINPPWGKTVSSIFCKPDLALYWSVRIVSNAAREFFRTGSSGSRGQTRGNNARGKSNFDHSPFPFRIPYELFDTDKIISFLYQYFPKFSYLIAIDQ